jgi:NAD(P)-dependent dehydrogenase (short-subunit alcohol dehydrogenase family)
MMRPMTGPRWTPDDIPDLAGRTALVTGANSGIGFEAARLLAALGARVVLGCRNLGKAEHAATAIRDRHPSATVDVVELDLADLSSVSAAADQAGRRLGHLDILVNNAGVMALPYRQTVDGFEMQFGTNHLGHFALTAQLLGLLRAAPAPRVVTVSSGMHKIGRMDFDNLDGARGYRKWPVYGMSKLANLLFTFELQRRADRAGLQLVAAAAHPGYTRTNLQTAGPRMAGAKLAELAFRAANAVVTQSATMGALPTVYAAVADDVNGGDYIGPRGPAEMRGYPVKVKATRAARNADVAARLWEVSESLTGVTFPWPTRAVPTDAG